MSDKKYFDRPTQVIFAEPGGDGWNAGIAEEITGGEMPDTFEG